MKIKLAGGSRIDFKDNLVPLFDLLAGYRETFGEGAEIDLSSNEELTLSAFKRAWAAIHNPTLSSAIIAADTMRTLNYLGYRTCARLGDQPPNSDTYIAFCACYSPGVTFDVSGHTLPFTRGEIVGAVRIHTIIAGGEVPRDFNFSHDLTAAWGYVGRRGFKSLELLRFVEKYGEYNYADDILPLEIPAFWRLPSAAGMISRTGLSWDLKELARSADDPVELRAAVIQFVAGNDVNTSGTCSVLPETREELDIWLAHDPDLSRVAASEQKLVELVRLIDEGPPHARFCTLIEMAIAIIKDDPERYNSAAAAISVIPENLAFLRLERDPPKIAAASDPEHNSALLLSAVGAGYHTISCFVARGAKSSIFARGAWGHGAMHYFASPGDPQYWLDDVFASRDPGWLLILWDYMTAAIARCAPSCIESIGSVEAYDVFCRWRKCPPNVFVRGNFIVGIRVMAKLVAAGRASESDAAANLQKFLRWFPYSQCDYDFHLDDLFAADAMLPDGIVSHMLHSGCFDAGAVRGLVMMGVKWNYDDIRKKKGRRLELEWLIA